MIPSRPASSALAANSPESSMCFQRNARASALTRALSGWLRAERSSFSRSSQLRGPIDYMLSRSADFAGYAADGRIRTANNCVERAPHGAACGRKAWLFAGSGRAVVMLTSHHDRMAEWLGSQGLVRRCPCPSRRVACFPHLR